MDRQKEVQLTGDAALAVESHTPPGDETADTRVTGRVWVYVRDDRPFGGKDPPAALFYASRDRTREHPEWHLASYAGILQADAFDGYNRLYLPDRKPGPIVEALCWSHGRRKFFELADIAANAKRGKNAAPISPGGAFDRRGLPQSMGSARRRSPAGRPSSAGWRCPRPSGSSSLRTRTPS